MSDATRVLMGNAPATPIYLALAVFLAQYSNAGTREQRRSCSWAADVRVRP